MSEQMQKGGRVKSLEIGEGDLALINKHALEPLAEEDVYTFRVAMCDNDIDREYERFDDAALNQMAKLFVGRTIIKDHRHQSDGQCARIYACEVEDAGGKTVDGEPYKQLVAKCYTLASEANAELVAEIKAGIKKEVSVSFRCDKAVCSICGKDNAKESCPHWWGVEYNGEKCFFTLTEITDAYELSFVAVPAQRRAGTKKAYRGERAEGKGADQEPKNDAESKPDDEPSTEEKELDARMRIAKAYLTLETED